MPAIVLTTLFTGIAIGVLATQEIRHLDFFVWFFPVAGVAMVITALHDYYRAQKEKLEELGVDWDWDDDE